MPITRTCDQCGIEFTRPPSLAGRYCSKGCAYAARVKPPDELRTRYRMVHAPNHPLATGSTRVLPEHRILLYDAIGPGPHPCAGCGEPIDWLPGQRSRIGKIEVDHVDRDPKNNALSNLAAVCRACNQENRVATIRGEEPSIRASSGRRLRAVERACEHCGSTFLAALNQVNVGRGRFCSRSCARKHQGS